AGGPRGAPRGRPRPDRAVAAGPGAGPHPAAAARPDRGPWRPHRGRAAPPRRVRPVAPALPILGVPQERRDPRRPARHGAIAMQPTDLIDQSSLRSDIPDFGPGDTLKVHVRVVEGSKERIQVFQGAVIARQGDGVRETFKVRKVSYGVGVERTFPVHTPTIAKIEVVSR